MRIMICLITLVLSWAWCSALAPEALNAAHVVWTANEEIIVTKSKMVLDLFLLGVFGTMISALSLWISCYDCKR